MSDTSNISSGGHTPETCYAESMGVREEDGKNTATLVFPEGNAPNLTLSDVWDQTPLVLMRADSHADLLAALKIARDCIFNFAVFSAERDAALTQIDAALIKGRAAV